jgi:hypothetical protein
MQEGSIQPTRVGQQPPHGVGETIAALGRAATSAQGRGIHRGTRDACKGAVVGDGEICSGGDYSEMRS